MIHGEVTTLDGGCCIHLEACPEFDHHDVPIFIGQVDCRTLGAAWLPIATNTEQREAPIALNS